MRNISYGALKQSKDCPSCFWWRIKHGINRLNSWQSNLPNVVENHILSDFHKYRELNKLPPELDIPELKDFKLVNIDLHNKWKNPFSGEPVFEDLPANPDEVLTDGEKLIIVDIKTIGKFPENCDRECMEKEIGEYDYKLQLEFYNYVFRKCGFKTEDFGYILFYYIDKGEGDGELILQSELFKVDLDLSNVEELLTEAREILKSDEFPESRCEFCSSHHERYQDLLKEQQEQEEIIKDIVDL